MMMRTICHADRRMGVWGGLRSLVASLCVPACLLTVAHAQDRETPLTFAVVGSQFHRRAPEDAGEARICICNTGVPPLSMSQLSVRVLAEDAARAQTPPVECQSVFVKLSPPVVSPGQHGEIVAKLTNHPAAGSRLTCEMFARSGPASHTVSLAEPPVWISFVGFSPDLRQALVYVENLSAEPVAARLLRVGPCDTSDCARAIHDPVPPRDKGCLIGDLPSPLSAGEFVHVAVATNVGGRESQVHTVIRAVHSFFVVMEGGSGDPRLGLDAQWPFVQTMACPAHAHGTHEQAAAKFLADSIRRFSLDPRQILQMHICRLGMPAYWFRFGDLPDVAVMNTCVRPPSSWDQDPQRWFCPFFCVGEAAKKTTEPGRNIALIHTGPDAEDEGSFILRTVTPQEWRLLVYCAVASGAKGVIYRGLPAGDPLSRDVFRRLNGELRHLKPLLSIADPVEWATTEESAYAAKGLLCGDQAVVIVVFDRRYFSRRRNNRYHTPSFARAVAPVRVNVRIPTGVAVKEVETVYGSLDGGSWICRDGHLALTAEMVDSAQVYVALLQRPMGMPEKGLSQ